MTHCAKKPACGVSVGVWDTKTAPRGALQKTKCSASYSVSFAIEEKQKLRNALMSKAKPRAKRRVTAVAVSAVFV